MCRGGGNVISNVTHSVGHALSHATHEVGNITKKGVKSVVKPAIKVIAAPQVFMSSAALIAPKKVSAVYGNKFTKASQALTIATAAVVTAGIPHALAAGVTVAGAGGAGLAAKLSAAKQQADQAEKTVSDATGGEYTVQDVTKNIFGDGPKTVNAAPVTRDGESLQQVIRSSGGNSHTIGDPETPAATDIFSRFFDFIANAINSLLGFK